MGSDLFYLLKSTSAPPRRHARAPPSPGRRWQGHTVVARAARTAASVAYLHTARPPHILLSADLLEDAGELLGADCRGGELFRRRVRRAAAALGEAAEVLGEAARWAQPSSLVWRQKTNPAAHPATSGITNPAAGGSASCDQQPRRGWGPTHERPACAWVRLGPSDNNSNYVNLNCIIM